MRRIGPWAASAGAALLLGPAFWLAATHASDLASTVAMAINVHGLGAPGYDGHFGRTMAPLSERIIADARHDAGSPPWPLPGPTTPPSSLTAAPLSTTRPSPSAGLTDPTLPRPSPTGLPLPTPAALPLPTPSTPPVPTPTGVPLPTPSASPLPTPTGLPLPTPTGLPLPTPTGLPLPTPTGLPLPTPTGLPIPIR